MSDNKMRNDENLSLEEIEAWMSQLASKPPPTPVLQPSTKLFQVQGEVIKINKPLLFFDVQTKQHCARVYVPFYGIIGRLVIFPRVGDFVKITKIRHFKLFYDNVKDNDNTEKTVQRSTSVINREAVFQIKSSTQNEIDKCDNQFLSFLNAHKIGRNELIIINENIVRIVECFIYSGDDLLLLIRTIYTELVCLAPSRKDFRVRVKLPIELKYVNPKYDNVYSVFDFYPPSAVNVYPSRTNLKVMTSDICYKAFTDCLVGTLVVQLLTAQFILKAYSANIVVKFIETSDSLEKFNNALVLIKKYTVFTEMFTVPNYPPLIYVLVDPQDVVIVKPYFESSFKIENKRLFRTEEVLPCSFAFKHQLEIVKKSDVIIGYKGNKETWMEARVESYCTNDAMKQYLFNAKSDRTFVIITGQLIKLAPILKQRQIYYFFTNIPLTPQSIWDFRELKALNLTTHIFYVPCDALFQESRNEPQVFEHIYQNTSVSELRCTMERNPSKTISFEIKISKKAYLIPPANFKSWYPKRHMEKFFGDIGNYQQRLMFYDEERNQYVDLYLSNRDNLAFPLGLVTDMKIRVNHVAINKGKYLKTTALTTFDVLEHQPRNKYSCANLAVTGDGKWNFRTTPPSLFGSDYHLPPNTIIHGLVIFRAIYDLNVGIVCGICKVANYQVAYGCRKCKSKELDAAIFIVFNAEDGSAREHFKMQIHSLDFLLDILTIKKEKKATFLKALQRYGPIDFNLLKVSSDFEEARSIVVETMIQKLRFDVNFNRPIMLNIVAMKQRTAPGCPSRPWLVLDHEFIVPTNEVMV